MSPLVEETVHRHQQEVTQILKFSDKGLKVAMIKKIPQYTIMDTHETNGKMESKPRIGK